MGTLPEVDGDAQEREVNLLLHGHLRRGRFVCESVNVLDTPTFELAEMGREVVATLIGNHTPAPALSAVSPLACAPELEPLEVAAR